MIAAAGGDGTLNAVVNGAAPQGRTLALLPLGTANVLAREIGLPHDTGAARGIAGECRTAADLAGPGPAIGCS